MEICGTLIFDQGNFCLEKNLSIQSHHMKSSLVNKDFLEKATDQGFFVSQLMAKFLKEKT